MTGPAAAAARPGAAGAARERIQVSVVVPARDEAGTIAALLASLAAQTRPADEIVVVDAGSRDRTAEIVAAAARRDARLTLVRAGPAFPGVARNLGVRAARHDVLAFTDAGIRLSPGWLGALCEPLERDAATDVVYGHLEPVTDSFFTECAAMAYVPAPRVHAGVRIRAPFVPSSLVRRRAWEGVGGFPPYRAAEDLMFMEAIARGGFRIAYAPGAVARWEIPRTWAATFRRFATYSRHNLRAGRARHWHYGVARLYAAAAACLALGVMHHRLWVAVPVAGGVARTLRTAYRKRAAFAFGGAFRPARLACLAALLLWLDAATAWGACVWAWRDGRRVGAASPTPTGATSGS